MFAPGAGRMIGPPALVALFLALVLAFGSLSGVAVGGLALALALALALSGFFAIFFRDPERTPGAGIVSAADGRVRAIETVEGRLRISVFMNVTDVHVNRLPLDATVTEIAEGGTGFRAAYLPAAEHNVRRHYRLGTALGPVEVVQITGVLARRLVSFVRPGHAGRKGERFGMIVLGSRVDVLLPAARAEAVVAVGDRVRAGETPIARERP